MRDGKKICYDCKQSLRQRNKELVESNRNMSYSLQPILPPSTSFHEATGNFVPYAAEVKPFHNHEVNQKSEESVLRAAGSCKPIAAGVRAGAHVRDLDSHGVLPIGPTEENWEARDARLIKEQNDKLKRFERDSEQDYLNWVKTKEKSRAEDKREKDRIRSMLEGYNPWGRPGGGAPANEDHRKNKFTEEDLQLDKNPRVDASGDFPFYKTGGGAALKTKSGRVKAGFSEAQDIRFKEETAKDIENKFRYEPENLSKSQKNLGRIPETDEITTNTGISIVEEMLKKYPYATANENKKTGMLTRSKKPPLEGESEVYDPWGKGFGAPNRDDNGNVRRYKFSDPRKGGINAMSSRRDAAASVADDAAAESAAAVDPGEVADWVGATIPLGRGGGGAPRNTKSGNVHSRFPQTLILTKQGDREQRMESAGLSSSLPNELMREDSNYNPWGRPGAGAPRRDGQGQLIHRKMRVPAGDSRLRLETKKSFLKEQEKLIDEQRGNRRRENQDMKAGYDDLASKINSGFVGRPKRDEFGQITAQQHLGVSDVTAQSTSYTRPTANPHQSKSYLTDLEKQATERRVIRDQEHQRANNDYRSHIQTFDQMWGRPGHGAPLRGNQGSVPNDGLYKKKNLIGSLYSNNFVQTLSTNTTPM